MATIDPITTLEQDVDKLIKAALQVKKERAAIDMAVNHGN